MRKTMLAVGLAVAALGGSTLADASEQAQAAKTKRVKVGDYFFKAGTVTINPRDSVRFAWVGEDEHNVRFTKVPKGAKKPKRCGTRTTGDCKRKFRKKGTYRYVCTLHALSMKGKVRVRGD